jgi:hypothetical protein
MKCTAACFVCLTVLMTAMPARAADTSYLGTWKLTDAVVAPWADAKQKPETTEKTRLIGKSVVLAPKGITGPNPLACAAPHYKVSNFTPDMIFQGAFGEMQSTNKAADPNKIAASLGFSTTSIRTLETGCEIDFHFVDATTAEIGLNNYVYTLKKQ